MASRKRSEKGIGFLLADVSRLLRRHVDRRMRDLDMTQAQWRALAHLAHDEGINQAALAERLEVKPITIARLIDRMEAAGWVRREADTADRRASLLFLMPRATPILDELQAHADAALKTLMRGIPQSVRRDFRATLERMKTNLNEAEETMESAPSKGKEDDGRRQPKSG